MVAAARAATEKAQAEGSAKAAALATAEQAKADLEKQLAAVAEMTAAAEKAGAAKLAEAERRLGAEADARGAAERAAAEARASIAQLEHVLAEEEKAHVAMAAQIDALKAQLPVSAGGTRTADTARAEAAMPRPSTSPA